MRHVPEFRDISGQPISRIGTVVASDARTLDEPRVGKTRLLQGRVQLPTHRACPDRAVTGARRESQGQTAAEGTLSRTASRCTARHCTARHCTTRQCTTGHCTVRHYTARHCTVRHHTARPCYTARHCTARNTVAAPIGTDDGGNRP